MALGSVDVEVLPDTSRFFSTLASRLSSGSAAFAAAGIAGLSVPVLASGAAFAASALKAADFDKQMAATGAVSNATAEQLATLREQALKAGADTAFSASQAAAGQEELIKAGVSLKDVLAGGLDGALSLAAAGGIDVAQAATFASNALNTFKLSGDQTTHVADVIAAAANKSAIDVTDFGYSMQAGGLVASQMGFSLEETAAAFAAFGQAGLKGSDAGTSFKTFLSNLTPATKQARAEMARLGLDFTNADGTFVSLAEVAGQLQTKLGGLTDEQRAMALETLFGSDSVRAASVLFSEGAAGVEKWTQAVSESGFAGQVASKRLDNLAGDIEAFKGSVETAFISAGSAASAPLRSIVQTATETVNGIAPIVSKLVTPFAGFLDKIMPRLIPALSDLADSFGVLAAPILDLLGSVLEPLLPALTDIAGVLAREFAPALALLTPVLVPIVNILATGLVKAIEFLGPALPYLVAGFLGFQALGFVPTLLTAIGGALSFIVANPVVVAVAAIGTAFVLAYKHIEPFRKAVDAVGRFLRDDVWPAIQEFASRVGDIFKDLFGGRFADAFAKLKDLGGDIIGALGSALSALGTWITQTAWPYLQANAPGWISAMFSWLGNAAISLLQGLGGLLVSLGQWLVGTALPFLASHAPGWVASLVGWIADGTVAMLGKLGEWLGALGGWIINTAIPGVLGWMAEMIPTLLGWVISAAIRLPFELAKLLVVIGKWIVVDAIPWVAEKAAGLVTSIIGWVGDAVSKLPGLLAGLQRTLADFLLSLPGRIAGFVSDAGSWLLHVGEDIIRGLIRGITNAAGSVKDTLIGIADDALGGVLSFLGIASPSRVFMAIGENVSKGLAVGIAGAGGQAVTAAVGLADQVTTATQIDTVFRAGVAAVTNSTSAAPSAQSQPLQVAVTLDLDGRAIAEKVIDIADAKILGAR